MITQIIPIEVVLSHDPLLSQSKSKGSWDKTTIEGDVTLQKQWP